MSDSNNDMMSNGVEQPPAETSMISQKRKSEGTLSTAARMPEFFLYTKMGQNETKNLKKAQTNRDERKVLAQIFKLNSLVGPDSPDQVEILRLDFHYINYIFCKENYFSNEKTSTLIAMLDSLLTRMLEKQLTSQ